MKYIKLFETASVFESAKATLDKPNVSLTENDMDVHYLPYVAPAPDPYNGHEYVEIGGLKWATMNIGANSITDYGLYFQWGDTQGYTASQVGSGEGKKYFNWADYKYCNGTYSVITKYNDTDGKAVLDLEDDAARVNMGGEWRMPTETEFQSLIDTTTNAWVTDYQGSGINGRLFTDKTDSSKVLFFPSAGFAIDGSMGYVGGQGFIWSSTLFSLNVRNCYYFSFSDNWVDVKTNTRCIGYSIRGVVG